MSVGLFLTPGAARTSYAVGALRGLVEEGGVRFDVIAGTSAGAVNGVFAAMGDVATLGRGWTKWKSRDVLGFDWGGVLRGGILQAPALMRYRAYRAYLSPPLVDAGRLLPGTRFRVNVADLATGTDEVIEWPGAPIPLHTGVRACVAVPAVVPPVDAAGSRWVDGLTVDGFALERLVLDVGVDRVFVLGVAPRRSSVRPIPNALRIGLRAIEANQLTETWLGLRRVEAANDRVRAWLRDRAAAEEAVREIVRDAPAAARMLAEVERAFTRSGFPYERHPVEIVAILPDVDLDFAYGDYRPERSLALMERGRADALDVLRQIASRQPASGAPIEDQEASMSEHPRSRST